MLFVYTTFSLSIHPLTLGSLPPFATVINIAMKMSVPVSVPVPAFNLLGIP